MGAIVAATVLASIYGGSDGLCGSRTATGERMICSALTVAHRFLPLGTFVRLKRAGHELLARVNDRGPFVRGRALDMTPRVARELGCSGLCYVEVEPIR